MSQFHDKKERKFMRKVTQVVTFLMIFALLVMPTVNVLAGINENEQELINIGNGVFTYNGVDYVATQAAKDRVYNYLNQPDVNLSASQAAEAQGEFWGNLATGIADGYLVPLNSPSEGNNSGNTSGGSGSNSGNTTGGGSSSSGNVTDIPNNTTPEAEVAYTYKDMANIMYAKQAVNVRSLPSTDGERIGSLSADQEVKVIGQCIETGWYRILYNGVVAYVSNNYLIDDIPVVETEETEVTTEDSTEILETEQTTEGEMTESANETGRVEETEVATDIESDITETEVESETETVLREKNFNKGLNMTTVAIITGGIVLVAAVIIVISHKNRRF